MIRSIVITFAVLSPFLFPYPLTLALSFAASLFIPPVALVVGILTDLLHYVPHASTFSLPLAALAGLLLSGLALLVRRFVKTRIIGG